LLSRVSKFSFATNNSTLNCPMFWSSFVSPFFTSAYARKQFSLLVLDHDSFDEDNVDEEKVKETGEIQGQTVGNLKDFYALGCELTDISGSVLLAEDSVVNVSAAESNRILKVNLRALNKDSFAKTDGMLDHEYTWSIKHVKRVSFDVYCPFISTDFGIAGAFCCLPIYSLLNPFLLFCRFLGICLLIGCQIATTPAVWQRCSRVTFFLRLQFLR